MATTKLVFLLLSLSLGARQAPVVDQVASDTVADRVVLKDGAVLLGQVLPSRPTRAEVVVRRAWARQSLSDRAAAWEAIERRTLDRARADRLDRLRRWREERRPPAGQAEPILPWIDGELGRLAVAGGDDPSPLMLVSIDRRDVSAIESRPEDRRRMLRQGWRAGFEDVESMPEDQLRAGLQARGFALSAVDPAAIDDLLPTPVESDRRWLARRASTEVLADPDLRLVRFGDLVLPDPGPGGAGAGAAMGETELAGVVGDLVGDLLGAPRAGDPLTPHLDRIEATGRVGAVVTQLEMSQAFDRVAVEASLLVRTGPGRWERAAWRRGEVGTSDLPTDAGRDLAADPQVRAAFGLLDALGAGGADPEAKQLGLAIGAATQAALNQARSALDADLHAIAIRLDPHAAPPRDPGSR